VFVLLVRNEKFAGISEFNIHRGEDGHEGEDDCREAGRGWGVLPPQRLKELSPASNLTVSLSLILSDVFTDATLHPP